MGIRACLRTAIFSRNKESGKIKTPYLRQFIGGIGAVGRETPEN